MLLFYVILKALKTHQNKSKKENSGPNGPPSFEALFEGRCDQESHDRALPAARSCQIICSLQELDVRWTLQVEQGEKNSSSLNGLYRRSWQLLVSVSRRCVSLARRLTVQYVAVFVLFFFPTELGLLCRNRTGLPVGFRGAHAARCKLSVLSKIIGYPKLIIAAKRCTEQ